MVCTQCGNDNPASNKFCGTCGTRLEAAAPPVIESKSRPVIRPIDLRDPTDPGHIRVPVEQRGITEPEDVSAPVVGPEPPAYETGSRLDEPLAYRGNEMVSAERVPIGETPANVLAVQTPDEREVAPELPRRDMSIHGPSLLGLSDDDQPSGPAADYSYLYEDEGSGRGVNWRLLTAVAVVLLFAGALALMWSQGKNWNSTIIKAVTGHDTKKEDAPVVAKAEPTTPGAPELQVTETQKPIPANATPQSDQNATASSSGSGNTNPAATGAAASTTNTKPADATDVGGKSASKAASDSAKTADAGASTAKTQSPETSANSKQEKADATDADDEDAADTAAPTPSASKSKAKPAATKQARAADQDETDDTATLVRRADVLLKARSCNQAVDLLREAALNGNATARSRLGGLYATGHCVPLDRAEAYNWFTLAKDAGARASWIEHNRSMLWASMTDRERERVMRR